VACSRYDVGAVLDSRRRLRSPIAVLLLGGALAPDPAQARKPAAAAPTVLGRDAAAATPLPTCDDLDPASLVQAIETELPSLLPPDERAHHAAAKAHASQVQVPLLGRQTLGEYARATLEPLLALARRGRAALCRSLPRQFRLLRLADASQGHVTAYYHPQVRGSRLPTGPYTHPLYRRPPEPQSQLASADILAGKLDGQGLELVYVDGPYTALNIHIEGSATVQLVEGGEINLTPDGHNGHPYVNPFKLARAEHAVPAPQPGDPPLAPGQSQAQRYFRAHPEILRSYWARNAHFVFFKETPLRGSGRFGQLVAGRSVAVDAALVPLGVALWLRSEVATDLRRNPGGEETLFTPIARLTLAQDTGAAIRGRGRVDLFVGSGPAAQLAATRTSRPGELFLLVHKPTPQRKKTAKKTAKKTEPQPTAQPTPTAGRGTTARS
jgi:membrane-bound lytic murein transglycosylase A